MSTIGKRKDISQKNNNKNNKRGNKMQTYPKICWHYNIISRAENVKQQGKNNI